MIMKRYGNCLANYLPKYSVSITGDYDAARELVEPTALKIDPELHAEVLERYKKLNLAPYKALSTEV